MTLLLNITPFLFYVINLALFLVLNEIKLHPEPLGRNPGDFTVGANRDFEIREKKALSNPLAHGQFVLAFNKGTVQADIAHDSFIIQIISGIFRDDGAWHARLSALVPFFPAI